MEDKILAQDDNLIVIDDGRKDVPIRNQFGEQIGVFRFNPTDVNIVNRYNEAAEKVDAIMEPLSKVSGDDDEDGDKMIEALNVAEKQMTELLDYVLDGNAKEAFFQKIHAFAVINGRFYSEVVMDAIGGYISRQFDVETKKINERVAKHVDKYRPNKRLKG